ncbi:uncharacterized protein LOC62_03G004150 [Vanrija pseudolonga]|uniref:Uncharacterized protein n=1 Tax=Vanrija pseudolonga TaxID=143232 RepID=A0AAF1BLB5_9TREE|nr:hypothetical protein LOC62_03G004150 [Vanrija pseudolonga]
MRTPPPTSGFTAQLIKTVDRLAQPNNNEVMPRRPGDAHSPRSPVATLAPLSPSVLGAEDVNSPATEAKEGLLRSDMAIHSAVEVTGGAATSNKTAYHFKGASECIEGEFVPPTPNFCAPPTPPSPTATDLNTTSGMPYHFPLPPTAHVFNTHNVQSNAGFYGMPPLGGYTGGTSTTIPKPTPFDFRLPHHRDYDDMPLLWNDNPFATQGDITYTLPEPEVTVNERGPGVIRTAPYEEYLSGALEHLLPLPKCEGTGGSDFHDKVIKGDLDLGALHRQARHEVARVFNAHSEFVERINYYTNSDGPVPDWAAPHVAFLLQPPADQIMAVHGIYSQTYMGATEAASAAPEVEDDEAAGRRQRVSAELLLMDDHLAILRRERDEAASGHSYNEPAHVCGANCGSDGTSLSNHAAPLHYFPAPTAPHELATSTTERSDPSEYIAHCSPPSDDGDTEMQWDIASADRFDALRRSTVALRTHNAGTSAATGPAPSSQGGSASGSGSGGGSGATSAAATSAGGHNPGDDHNDDGDNGDDRGRPNWLGDDIPFACPFCKRTKDSPPIVPNGYQPCQFCPVFYKEYLDKVEERKAAKRSPPTRVPRYVPVTEASQAQMQAAEGPKHPFYNLWGINLEAVNSAAERYASHAASAGRAEVRSPPTPEPRPAAPLKLTRAEAAEPRAPVLPVRREEPGKKSPTRAETAARLRNPDIDTSRKFAHLPPPKGEHLVSAWAPAAGPLFCSGPPRDNWDYRGILNSCPELVVAFGTVGAPNNVLGSDGANTDASIPTNNANAGPSGTHNAATAAVPTAAVPAPAAPTLNVHVTFLVDGPLNGGNATVTRADPPSPIAVRPSTPYPAAVVPPFVLDTPSDPRSPRTVVPTVGFTPTAAAPGPAPAPAAPVAPAPARTVMRAVGFTPAVASGSATPVTAPAPPRARGASNFARASARAVPAAAIARPAPAPAPTPAPPALAPPAVPAAAAVSPHATSPPIDIPARTRQPSFGSFGWGFSEPLRPRRRLSFGDDNDEDKAASLPEM